MERKKWEGSGHKPGWKWRITGEESEEQKKWIGVTFQELEQRATTFQGKKFVKLEDYLEEKLRHPEHRDETLVLNATEILRLLGINTHSPIMTDRTHNWLTKYQFPSYKDSYQFKVALRERPSLPCIII